MNSELYNYILEAVTQNANTESVQKVIGGAKYNYLKKIAEDKVKLKEAIEQLLKDEFVQDGLREELTSSIDTDFLLEKTSDETTNTLLPQIKKLAKFDNSLSYLSNFNKDDFSKEKALKLIQTVETKIKKEKNYDNFINLISRYFFVIQDFDNAEYFLLKSSSILNKWVLCGILIIKTKFSKAISLIIELYELDDNRRLNLPKGFELLTEPHPTKKYKKEDIKLGLDYLYNSKLSTTIDLTHFVSYFIVRSECYQFTQNEIRNILLPYLEIIEQSKFKNSPGLVGLYSMSTRIIEDEDLRKRLEEKANKLLAENNYKLEDFDKYPFSISHFVIKGLPRPKIFIDTFKNFRNTLLENEQAKQQLSAISIIIILLIINDNNFNISPQVIKIKNYKLLKNHQINLPSQTNIFLGFNGAGKTSLLQAIALSLLPKLDKDINPNKYERLITIGEEEIDIKVNWSDDIISRSLTIKDTGKTINYPIFTHHEDEFLSRFILLGYGSNNFTKYTQHNYDEVVLKMLAGDDKFYHVSSLFEDYSDDFHDPLGVLNILDRYEDKDIEGKKEEATIVKALFLNALNELIIDYEIKKIRTGYKFFRGEQALDLKHLSEGYRAITLLITDILIRIISLRPKKLEEVALLKEKPFILKEVLKEAKGTILIDEFNRHLHPQWQRRFIDDLRKVLPNVQLVLTTHSPVAVLGREEDEVQVLEINEAGEIEIKRHEGGTKNLDVSLTLLKYFELDSVVSPQLQEKIDRYYELQLNGERDEALEKELEEVNLGIPIYDSRYLKFLEFLKKRNIGIRDSQTIEDIDVNSEEWDELEDELAELLD